MALKDILKMTEVDRYTADGCEELNKALEAATEDARPTNGIYHWKSGDYRKEGDKYVKIGPGSGGAGNKSTGTEGNLKPSRKVDQKKHPLVTNPDVLGMTANGARKRMEAHGAQFVENKNGMDYFKTKSGDLVEVRYNENKKVDNTNTYTGGKKPEQAYPSTQGHDMQSYMSKLREEGWENQGWERNAANEARGIYKKGDKTIRVKKNWDGSLGGVSEIKTSTESKPAEKPETEPKHTLEVGSEVKFKKSGQPITIKKIENYGGTPIVVGEYDYNGKRETNRFRLDELDYEQKEERKDLVSGNTLEEGRTVNFKKTGQPIKIKKVEYYGSTPIIVGEYEHNGKTETNRFRMDEIETPDSAPRELTGDCKIRIRK